MYHSSKKSISKIVCIFLISSILICACSTTSFADTGNLDFLINDLPYYAEYYDSQNGTYQSLNVTKSIITHKNIQACRFIVSRASGNYSRFASVYKVGMLKANHEYSLQFSYAYTQSSTSRFNTTLQILNGNGVVIQSQTIYSLQGAASTEWQNVIVNFVPDLSNVNQGYTMRLVFEFVQTNNTYDYTCYLSNNVYFNDNDDDSGWFQSIITWIQNVVTSISNGVSDLLNSISTLGSNIGTWFTNLGNNISTWLTTLGNNISTWLTNVKDGIVNKLQSVQTAITNAIDGIQQWFINLGNRIGEFFTMLKNYILYFQHPVTLNADGVPVDGNGNPVYTNPFDDTLDSVSDTLDDWFDSLDDFILTIQSVNVQITGYLQTFTNIFNRFNAGVPIIGVIITLALIVIVIKKIMGR